jgi:hypothetical protein
MVTTEGCSGKTAYAEERPYIHGVSHNPGVAEIGLKQETWLVRNSHSAICLVSLSDVAVDSDQDIRWLGFDPRCQIYYARSYE